MKKNIKILALAITLFGIIAPHFSYSQNWGGRRKPGFLDNWSIGANVGFASYFGDLSIYDTEIVKKITQESAPSGGLILTKHFNQVLGVSGQILFGSLKGENNNDVSFKTSFVEYNVQLRIEFVNLFSPYNISPVGIQGFGGFGQMVFKSEKSYMQNEELVTKSNDSYTVELAYFLGVGISYKLTDDLMLTGDVSIRQVRNDKLDYVNKNEDYDFFTYASLGLVYKIESFKSNKYGRSRGKYTRGRSKGRLPLRRRR